MRHTRPILYRIYIDEAGDRGFSRRSSQHFLVAAIVVPDHRDADARAALAELRQSLGRGRGEELHFLKFNHSQRIHAAQATTRLPVSTIAATIMCKEGLRDGQPTALSAADHMYLYALRLLMERVSWFVKGNGGTAIKATFAEVKGFKASKLHEYRRRLEVLPRVTIDWSLMQDHPFRIARPGEVELLQVADTAASAIYQAVEPDDWENTEPRYLNELRPKIYRGAPAPVTSYGLKVFPPKMAEAGGSLHFLRQM